MSLRSSSVTAPARSRRPTSPVASNQDPRARTGLGLSLVREIVESRHGRLEAGVAPEGGALVTLALPMDGRTSARHRSLAPEAGNAEVEPALR